MGEPTGTTKLLMERDALRQRVAELEAIINNPHIQGFANSVCMEAAHQRERWGAEHDAGKSDEEWFWLIGHLASKALISARLCEDGRLPLQFLEEHRSKTLHHIITTAAALANWYAARTGESNIMRPGIDPTKRTVSVSSEALFRVLFATIGPDHYIRELQYTRENDVTQLVTGEENPINVLLREYNTWANAQIDKQPVLPER